MTVVANIGASKPLTIAAFFAALESAVKVVPFSKPGDRFGELWYELIYQVAFENNIRVRELDCESAIEVCQAAGFSEEELFSLREAAKSAYAMTVGEIKSLPSDTLLGPATQRYLREFAVETQRLEKQLCRSRSQEHSKEQK